MLLVIAFAAQSATSMLDKSSTYDAQVYVLAGIGYLQTGDYALKQDAPPLIPLLAAVATKFLSGSQEVHLSEAMASKFPEIKQRWRNREFSSTEEYDLARAFFRENDEGRQVRLIQYARLPMIAIACLLGVYIYRFGKILFGPTAGIAALFLFVTDPNMIGHARVVAADLPLACFFLISIYYFYRSVTEKPVINVVMLGVSSAICVGVKLSGLILLPTLLMLTATLLVVPPQKTMELLTDNSQARKWLLQRAVLGATLVSVFSLAFVCVLYRDLQGPLVYFESTKLIYSNVPEDYQSFLFGKFAPQFWYYYPAAFSVKSPLTTVVLTVLAIVWLFRGPQLDYRWLVVPIIFYGLVCCFDGINIGLRRILTVFPLIFLLIGRMVGAWVSVNDKTRQRAAWSTLAFVSLLYAWTAVGIYPDHLNFFNVAAGGPTNGYKHLTESNVSWGQNLPALQRYLEAEGIGRVRMSFYGNESRESYGIEDDGFTDYEVYWPIQDVYVMSAHSLIVHAKNQDEGSDWMARFQPRQVIRNSLFIFDLRQFPFETKRDAKDALRIARWQMENKKASDSVVNFQAYLKEFPQDRQVHLELADAAESFGHHRLAKHHRTQAEKYNQE